jgi:hypothetical protein
MYNRLIAACRPGASTELLAAYEAAGEPIPPMPVAHGLGLGFDPPVVSEMLSAADEHERLDPGMVLAITGYVWQQGVGAVLRRDTVQITDDGAQVLTTSDIRFSTRDSSTAVENLLAVTGEDVVSVARKYKAAVSAKLGVRFHASANEIPRWSDNSSALQRRALLLETTRGFRDTEDEDTGLKRRRSPPASTTPGECGSQRRGGRCRQRCRPAST